MEPQKQHVNVRSTFNLGEHWFALVNVCEQTLL